MTMDYVNMLHYLEHLLKHGTFTKAAKALYISQPYLTQTIKKVERDLGVEIIDRTVTPLQLTEAGGAYRKYLKSLESGQETFRSSLTKYQSPDKQLIRIGVLASLGQYLLPRYLPEFLQGREDITFQIFEDLPENNEKRLLGGEVDFFIGQNYESLTSELRTHNFGKNRYFAIIPSSSRFYCSVSRFLEPGSLKIKDILSEKLVLTTHGSEIRRQLDYLLKKYKVTPDIVVETGTIQTVVALAEGGIGTTIVPEVLVHEDFEGPFNLYLLPDDVINLSFFIAYPLHKTLNPSEKLFLKEFLKKSGAQAL